MRTDTTLRHRFGHHTKRRAAAEVEHTHHGGKAPQAGTASSCRALTKLYGAGEVRTTALAGVDLAFERGKFASIMGPSGSGKSTLLYCLAGLERPTSGEVLLGGIDLSGLDDTELTLLRRRRVGYVFQSFNLVPTLSARENIELPLLLDRRRADPEWLDELIGTLGIRHRLHHRPAEMSGGEQQRVAVARALVTRPEVVFADEPTGNLDSTSSADLLSMLRRAVDHYHQTVVMVTHAPEAAAWSDRVVFLRDGQVEGDLDHPTLDATIEHIRAAAHPASSEDAL